MIEDYQWTSWGLGSGVKGVKWVRSLWTLGGSGVVKLGAVAAIEAGVRLLGFWWVKG